MISSLTSTADHQDHQSLKQSPISHHHLTIIPQPVLSSTVSPTPDSSPHHSFLNRARPGLANVATSPPGTDQGIIKGTNRECPASHSRRPVNGLSLSLTSVSISVSFLPRGGEKTSGNFFFSSPSRPSSRASNICDHLLDNLISHYNITTVSKTLINYSIHLISYCLCIDTPRYSTCYQDHPRPEPDPSSSRRLIPIPIHPFPQRHNQTLQPGPYQIQTST